jgi:hypothetical protein
LLVNVVPPLCVPPPPEQAFVPDELPPEELELLEVWPPLDELELLLEELELELLDELELLEELELELLEELEELLEV